MPRKPTSNLFRVPKRFSIKKILFLLLTLLLGGGVTAYDQVARAITLPADGEPTRVYASQTSDNLRKLYLEAIDSARESIYFYIYALSDPAIINQLRKKADEGVAVFVLVDKDTGGRNKPSLGKKARLVIRQNEGLSHLKILVIDDHTTLLGSANMTSESLSVHHNNVCAIRSASLASHLKGIWNVITKPNSLIGGEIPEAFLTIGDQPVEAWLLSGNPRASHRIVELIDSAKKSVRVAMFTFTRYDLVHALLRAQKRGLRVEVALDAASAKGASHHIATLLYLQGVPLSVSRGPPLLHHKMLIVDDDTFVTGSANWTKAAFQQNDDCFLVIRSLYPIQSQKIEALWENIQRDCEPYSSAYEREAA